MRLSQLIVERREPILQDFENFARTHTAPGASMNVEALRDHAAAMLDAIAHDLEQPQTDADRDRKGRGDGPRAAGVAATAAESHGAGRVQSGFSLEEAFAEYRALRASVMRHWIEAHAAADRAAIADLIRFNEAIDQALAESVHEYARAVSEHREMFLAVLGHDLRSPLNGILNAASFLAEVSRLPERDQRLMAVIHGSAKRMQDLIEDMLDFASSRLSAPMPLRRVSADIGGIASDIVRQCEVTHPGRAFRTQLDGDLSGEWDVRRLRQALLNLVDNAVHHGAADSAITISACGDSGSSEVVVSVHNVGPPIPPAERERIFEPFRRGSSSERGTPAPRGGVGLGLYIARRMAEAHGGSLGVVSSRENGTTFSIVLPRRSGA